MASAPLDPAPRAPWRLWLVPVASTLAGSLLAAVPLVVETPWWPSFGLLMLLGWRLYRPELWPAWVALPLGLFDDLVGGAPLGAAGLLWTLAFLGLDAADARGPYRAFADAWGLAAAAIAFVTLGQWAVARFAGGAGPAWTMLPQLLLGVLLFVPALRLCARLDRWRLRTGPRLAS